MIITERDAKRIEGIHPLLVGVVAVGMLESPHEYHIPRDGGLRTEERQAELVKKGRSKTMNSYHRTGKAFDIYILDDEGKPTWAKEFHYKYEEVARHLIKLAKERHNLDLIWGGDWKGFVDRPHFQIK